MLLNSLPKTIVGRRIVAAFAALALLAACGSSDPNDLSSSATAVATAAPATATTAPVEMPTATAEPVSADPATPLPTATSQAAVEATAEPTTATAADATTTETQEPEASADGEAATASSEDAPAETAQPTTAPAVAGQEASGAPAPGNCEQIAELFVTRGSANANLDDPEVDAVCQGNSIVVTSNGIPDYTYIETSPGQPRDQNNTFVIPATPTIADSPTAVPLLGTAAVTLGGIQIFGPTEGTGGDVESLPGILSACGSHNGPSGFHIHLILTSSQTDCLFTPAEVAAAPQLVGYAFDGFPIYTGIDQYRSSWQLTDESLFATDTWAAHSYVEGSGDLDRCNGRTDANGNYAYYTTATFPYVLGCYTGVVDLTGAGGGGGGAGGAGGGGERPERPEGAAPEGAAPEGAAPEGAPPEGAPPEGAEGDAARPERPERPEGDVTGGGERPERPERPGGAGAPPEGAPGE